MASSVKTPSILLLAPGLFLLGTLLGAVIATLEEYATERSASGLIQGGIPPLLLIEFLITRFVPPVALGMLLAHTSLARWRITAAGFSYSIGWMYASSCIRPILLGEFWPRLSGSEWRNQLLGMDLAGAAMFGVITLCATIVWRHSGARDAWVRQPVQSADEPPPLPSSRREPAHMTVTAAAARRVLPVSSRWPRFGLVLVILVLAAEATLVGNDAAQWKPNPFVSKLGTGWEAGGGFIHSTFPGKPTVGEGAMLRTHKARGEVIMLGYDKNAQGASPLMQLQVHYEKPSFVVSSFEGSSPFILCNLDKDQADWVLANGVPQSLIDALCVKAAPLNRFAPPASSAPAIWVDPAPFIPNDSPRP